MLYSLLLLACLPAAAAGQQALTFEEARKAMLAANPQARAAALDLETAASREASARGGLYPSFYADADWARAGSQGADPYDSYSYGFSGSSPRHCRRRSGPRPPPGARPRPRRTGPSPAWPTSSGTLSPISSTPAARWPCRRVR